MKHVVDEFLKCDGQASMPIQFLEDTIRFVMAAARKDRRSLRFALGGSMWSLSLGRSRKP